MLIDDGDGGGDDDDYGYDDDDNDNDDGCSFLSAGSPVCLQHQSHDKDDHEFTRGVV